MLYDDAHTLGLRGERKVLENVILFNLTVRIDKLDIKLLTIDKLHVKLLSEFHKCDLIRTRCLEVFLGRIIRIWVHRRHIVTQRQG